MLCNFLIYLEIYSDMIDCVKTWQHLANVKERTSVHIPVYVLQTLNFKITLLLYLY